MIYSREAFFIAAIVADLLSTQAMPASILSGNSSPLCLVPVKNGKPTKADFYQSFRLTFKVVSLRGLNGPIIFPLNRGGVWTIDPAGAYVPFGGDFPNHFQDQYASDTTSEGKCHRPLAPDIGRVPVHASEVENVLRCRNMIPIADATDFEGLRDMRSRICAEFRHVAGCKKIAPGIVDRT